MLYISYYSAFSLFTMSYNYPKKMFFGGGKENRTPDPLLAKQVLSQLSYTPKLVGLGRLELPTLRLSGVRSNHLSYKPSKGFATLIFFLRGYADGIPFYFIL